MGRLRNHGTAPNRCRTEGMEKGGWAGQPVAWAVSPHPTPAGPTWGSRSAACLATSHAAPAHMSTHPIRMLLKETRLISRFNRHSPGSGADSWPLCPAGLALHSPRRAFGYGASRHVRPLAPTVNADAGANRLEHARVPGSSWGTDGGTDGGAGVGAGRPPSPREVRGRGALRDSRRSWRPFARWPRLSRARTARRPWAARACLGEKGGA